VPVTYDTIIVDPSGQEMAVDITLAYSGPPLAAYTAKNGASAHSFPVTISSVTEFHVASSRGRYSVSAKSGERELANGSGGVAVLDFSSGSSTPQRVTPAAGSSSLIAMAAGGGSGTSSALSTKKIARVDHPGGQTLAFGGANRVVSFAGSTVSKGDDYWGTPGTALDLDVVADAGGISLPDADTAYDIWIVLTVACDAADDGKTVGCYFTGYDPDFRTESVVAGAGHEAKFKFTTMDRVFAGEEDAAFVIKIDTSHLTVDATVAGYVVIATR
jgi:hypothetical protein